MRERMGRTRVGGSISNQSWKTNLSSGIIELTYAPRICSLPIQPNKSTLPHPTCKHIKCNMRIIMNGDALMETIIPQKRARKDESTWSERVLNNLVSRLLMNFEYFTVHNKKQNLRINLREND